MFFINILRHTFEMDFPSAIVVFLVALAAVSTNPPSKKRTANKEKRSRIKSQVYYQRPDMSQIQPELRTESSRISRVDGSRLSPVEREFLQNLGGPEQVSKKRWDMIRDYHAGKKAKSGLKFVCRLAFRSVYESDVKMLSGDYKIGWLAVTGREDSYVGIDVLMCKKGANDFVYFTKGRTDGSVYVLKPYITDTAGFDAFKLDERFETDFPIRKEEGMKNERCEEKPDCASSSGTKEQLSEDIPDVAHLHIEDIKKETTEENPSTARSSVQDIKKEIEEEKLAVAGLLIEEEKSDKEEPNTPP